MTLRLALRSLVARPVRSAVLACGFGFGIAVMAALLGVGEVILEQSRARVLVGGGDVMVSGASSGVASARFVMTSMLGSEPFASRVRSISPSGKGTLYLVDDRGVVPVYARAGIPSLERAIGDTEIAQVPSWQDPASAARWTRPDAGEILRTIDRFHPIPTGSDWDESWAEWLYFNGRSADGSARFYLTFIVGGPTSPGRRSAGVRLQLERGGTMRTYLRSAEVDEDAVLAQAPDLEIAGNRVRLEGLEYRITLALDAERAQRSEPAQPAGHPKRAGRAEPGNPAGSDLSGDLIVRAIPGRSVPPFQLRGARGWVSGYVVPVLSGTLDGSVRTRHDAASFDGGTGYHDHNWGFWEGVTWQWGQVAHDDLSIVYGRVHPPAKAADSERVPGFLAVLGPQGPLGFSMNVQIREDSDVPSAIAVVASGPGLEIRLDAAIRDTERTRMPGPFVRRDGTASTFFQMRADFRVQGQVGDRALDFTAPGSAETFRAW